MSAFLRSFFSAEAQRAIGKVSSLRGAVGAWSEGRAAISVDERPIAADSRDAERLPQPFHRPSATRLLLLCRGMLHRQEEGDLRGRPRRGGRRPQRSSRNPSPSFAMVKLMQERAVRGGFDERLRQYQPRLRKREAGGPLRAHRRGPPLPLLPSSNLFLNQSSAFSSSRRPTSSSRSPNPAPPR